MDTVEGVLEHYGIKGMRWGVRRTRAQLDSDSADAAKKKELQTVVKKNRGSTDPLSNQELQSLVTRLNLEQQYTSLTTKENVKKKSNGEKFVADIVQNVAKKQSQYVLNTVAQNQIDDLLKKQGMKK